MNLRTLDLNLLRVFEAIYLERNVSLAARRENLTQPAMSNALARLRRSFDDALFVKIGARMEPTALAQQLIEPVQEALALLRKSLQAREAFDPLQSARTFRLLMSDAGESAILPALVRNVAEAAPSRVGFEVVKLAHEAYADALQTGAADFAIGHVPFLRSGFERRHLFDDPYSVVVRQDHPLARERLSLPAFAAAQHVAVATGSADVLVDRQLSRHRLRRDVRLKVSHYHVAVDVVARSNLLAVVPGMIARRAREVATLPLPLPMASASVHAVWHTIAQRDPGSIWVRNVLAGLDLSPWPAVPSAR